MGAFLGFIFVWWIFIAIIFSFYAWLKMTNKSDDPMSRRFKALGLGLAWPVLLVKAIVDRKSQAAESASREDRSRDLLD